MRNCSGISVILVTLLARSLAGQTVEFAPSTIPGFQIFAAQGHDNLFAATVPDSSGRDAISPVLPLSVYVQNNGTRSAVKLVVRWDWVNAGGKGVANTVARDFTLSPLGPQGVRLITPVSGFTQAVEMGQTSSLLGAGYGSQMQTYDMIARSPTIRVSLDAVVFDNGEFQGPDLFGSFAATTTAHAYLMSFLSDLKTLAGQPDQNVQAKLTEVIQAKPLGLNQAVTFSKRTAQARLLQAVLTMKGRAEFERVLDQTYRRYSSETGTTRGEPSSTALR
jgi:hypothetical protein